MRGMQISSKLLFRTTVVLLGVMLAATVFVVMNSQKAGALGPGELAAMRDYINNYINSQYDKGADGQAGTADDPAEGEGGFVRDRDWLRSRIDSNGDMNLTTGAGVLSEGDDAALAPVIIDNLFQTDVIPGTSIQCRWNSDLGATNCFDAAKVDVVKAKVEAHAEAGFSTDIVDYCLSGHTEAPTTGAWGTIAQTGGLGQGAYPGAPRVYAFKWGRNGWVGTAGSYPNSGSIGAASQPSSYTDPTNSAPCNDRTPGSELARCTAQWAIYGSGNGPWGDNGANIAAGNVGNGQSPNTLAPYSTSNPDLAAGQIVDIRVPSPANTIVDANGSSPTVQIPVYTIFNSGRSALNSTLAPGATGILVAGRTQMMGGIVAVGLKMLGYPMATNGFLNSGMRKWNNTLDEEQAEQSIKYPLVKPATIDNTAPTVSNLGLAASQTGANITWETNEPATTVVEYSTSPGGPYTKVTTGCDYNGNTEPCTVLRSNQSKNSKHSLTLSGLTENTKYYYRVTSYDGQANSSASAEQYFWTDVTPPAVSYVGPTGTITDTRRPPVTVIASDNASGVVKVTLTLNNVLADPDCDVDGSNITCTPTFDLLNGPYSPTRE